LSSTGGAMDRLRRGGSLPGRQACAAAQRLRHVGVLSGQYALRLQAPRDRNPAVSVSTRSTARTNWGWPYSSKEGVIRDVREKRAGVLTGAGGDLLRQLLTGRRVAVHRARH
jgi:hypothetical protein